MTISPLVTYDAICKAVAGRKYAWHFRSSPNGPVLTFYEVNDEQIDGTLMLWQMPTGTMIDVEIYLVRWSDGQYTLERVF